MARHSDDIQLKTPDQIRAMRVAGLLVQRTLATVRAAVAPGVSTGELDDLAEATIRGAGGVPSFKGYHGFPASLCTSVNEQIVHAIPSKNQVLKDGDIVSIDCGAIVDGWHGDSAITVAVGEIPGSHRRLIDSTEEALWAGIAAMRHGGRLTDISHAIEKSIRAAGKYGIVRGYGGHGIGTEMHQDPHVLNYGRGGRGPKLVPGMALAIEPMITLGSAKTRELSDGWTVVSADRSVAVHVEHTVAICEDGLWILTAEDGGRAQLGGALSAMANE